MPEFDYDFYVIGAGSGGVRASRIAAGLGARTGICESYRVGGTCVIRGCVPKKLLAYAAGFSEEFDDAAGYGWQVDGWSFSWPRLIANKNREIDRLNEVYIRLLQTAGVELHQGRGVLEGPHTVVVDGRRLTARHILIATGGAPWRPQIPGHELAITSNEAFELTELPRRIAVYGAGYIALEFACIFAGLGSEVTLVYRGPEVLRGFDHDVRTIMREELQHKGIRLRLETEIARLERAGNAVRCVYADDVDECFEQVMFATGRAPAIAGLGLEAAGVEVTGGAIRVDEYSRTSVPHIYAVGDVTDRMPLTPVALMEGQAVAHTLFADRPTTVDHAFVPTAVFSRPEVATVGYSEAVARELFADVDIYMSAFRPLKHTLSGREEKTLMKLVVDAGSQRVVGCHIVGLYAAEMLQGVAVAIKLGATKSQFDQTIGIHPTSAEELVTMRHKSR